MLPGPVLVILRILSCLTPLHLVLAVGGSFVFDDRAARICCTLAIVSVICALTLHTHDRMDERITKGLAAQEHALDAAVHVVDVMAGDPPPERPSRPLRAVPDDA